MELIYSNNNMLHSMWLKVVFFPPVNGAIMYRIVEVQ